LRYLQQIWRGDRYASAATSADVTDAGSLSSVPCNATAVGQIITPWKQLYLAILLEIIHVLVKPQILYIKNCKQFIQCCISDRYKTI